MPRDGRTGGRIDRRQHPILQLQIAQTGNAKTWNYSQIRRVLHMQHCTAPSTGTSALIHTQTRHMHMICSSRARNHHSNMRCCNIVEHAISASFGQVCVCVCIVLMQMAPEIIIAVSVAEREYVLRIQCGQMCPGTSGSAAVHSGHICGDVLFNLFAM